VEGLSDYVRRGGRLLVTGAAALDRFGAEFLGVREAAPTQAAAYYVSAAEATVPVKSDAWRLVEPTTAHGVGTLGRTYLREAELLPYPAATVNHVGAGRVAYVPWELFRSCRQHAEPLRRAFVRQLIEALEPCLSLRVQAPPCVDVVLRRQDERRLVHLVNRAGAPGEGTVVEEVPPVGPVVVEMDLPAPPRRVELAPESGEPDWEFLPAPESGTGGTLRARIAQVALHTALVVE